MNRRGRILLVDDDSFQRRVLLDALRSQYEVAEARSGQECLDLLPEFLPDVILLDVKLGDMDGRDVCREIRDRRRELLHTKVILMSSHGELEDRLRGYEAGANDYVVKPFDLTEIRAKLDVLLSLRSDEEVSDLKTQFLNLMSHETRTPLTSIIGPAQVLATEGLKDDDRKMFANMILESARRLEDLVEKATELTAIRAGQAVHHSESVDLSEVVRSVAGDLKVFAGQKEVDLTVDVEDGIQITADWHHANLLIRTLLERAIRVSPEESSVAIEVKSEGEERVVRVEDQGEPIDPEAIPTLFEDFHVPSVEFHTGGLGLDLALCGAIVHLHGGLMEVEATSEEGNRFLCRLPLNPEAPVSGATSGRKISKSVLAVIR